MMKNRGTIPSLKSTVTQLLAQLTGNAFQKIFEADLAEKALQRKCTSYKRKRSRSCDTEEQGNLNKKARVSGDRDRNINISKKRALEDAEEEDVYYKRRKTSLGSVDCVKLGLNEIDYNICKDDTTVNYFCKSDCIIDILRNYFQTLPSPCWDQYSNSLLNILTNLSKIQILNNDCLKNVLRYVACDKLERFSTKLIEPFAGDIMDIFYNQLKYCRNLLSLEITFTPNSESPLVKMLMAFQRLKHLQSLYLVPNTKYSYHWIFDEIAHNCPKLRELKVVYDGDNFLPNQGISVLKLCRNLCAIWLLNFGRKSETKSLAELLKSLVNVKVLFHKELPNAILELTKDESDDIINLYDQTTTDLCCPESIDYITQRDHESRPALLGLERVDLCWYQEGIGYQLVYIPTSYLLQVARACPKISLINLIGSTCLSQVIARLPNLQAIVLMQTSFALSLRCTLKSQRMEKLTVLRLSDVWDITYDMISYIAYACINLQVLSISCSSLEARGRLVCPLKRPPFENLRHLTLVPGPLENCPSLTAPLSWELGTELTRYLFRETWQLSFIHIYYKQDDLPAEDTPTEALLEEVLCTSRPHLQSLLLEWPPALSHDFVKNLVEACPDLCKLGSLTTWPFTNEQRAFLITSYGHDIDIS
ncbi:uncharacterized protein [Palaemon carinicauda]|uniref:uncharacterized protein n=1 Tax=Palaemon carinicauda TaxID=392227 RepID=UPI0035B5EDD1